MDSRRGKQGKKKNKVEKLTLDISQVNVVGGSITISTIIITTKLPLQTNVYLKYAQVCENIYCEHIWTLVSDCMRKDSLFFDAAA